MCAYWTTLCIIPPKKLLFTPDNQLTWKRGIIKKEWNQPFILNYSININAKSMPAVMENYIIMHLMNIYCWQWQCKDGSEEPFHDPCEFTEKWICTESAEKEMKERPLNRWHWTGISYLSNCLRGHTSMLQDRKTGAGSRTEQRATHARNTRAKGWECGLWKRCWGSSKSKEQNLLMQRGSWLALPKSQFELVYTRQVWTLTQFLSFFSQSNYYTLQRNSFRDNSLLQ